MVNPVQVPDNIYPDLQNTVLTNKPYKIMIIQNISHYTSKIVDYGNTLGLLPFRPSIPTWNYSQNLSMQDIVFLGRMLGIKVDYFLLSFDFGLIPATTPIPTYDLTVSDQYSSRSNHRAKELHIPETVANFPFYDLIFVDIPNTLHTLLNPAILCNKATEIVYFTANLFISPPLLGFNLQELKEMIKNRSFLPLQVDTNTKVNLLANYILMKNIFPNKTFLNFIQAVQDRSQYL